MSDIQVGIASRHRLWGQKFGRLTIVDIVKKPLGRKGQHWECRCDCGNIAVKLGSDLRRMRTLSCGCWKDEKDTRNMQIGQKFGRLTVLERTSETNNNRSRLYKVLCDCGSEVLQPGSLLINGNTLSCGCLRAEIESKNLRESAQKSKERANITGCKIGLLNVLGVDGADKNGHTLYRCVCVCGKYRTGRRKDILRKSRSKLVYPPSCGCRGKGFIESFVDSGGRQKWRMIDTKGIIPITLSARGEAQ